LVNICGYELPTNLQNLTQKDLTEVKIFQKVLGGYFFSNTLYTNNNIQHECKWCQAQQISLRATLQGAATWRMIQEPLFVSS